MVIRQIKKDWYSLKSTCDGETSLVWFGYSRAEVLQKFRSYIRDRDLENLRLKPRGIKR